MSICIPLQWIANIHWLGSLALQPKVELIRKSFIQQTLLYGGVKIAHYNAKLVFIDLKTELNYNTFWTQQRGKTHEDLGLESFLYT